MTTSFVKEWSEVSFFGGISMLKGGHSDDFLLEYQRMADALAQVGQNTGTEFVYSLCEWGLVSLKTPFLYPD